MGEKGYRVEHLTESERVAIDALLALRDEGLLTYEGAWFSKLSYPIEEGRWREINSTGTPGRPDLVQDLKRKVCFTWMREFEPILVVELVGLRRPSGGDWSGVLHDGGHFNDTEWWVVRIYWVSSTEALS